MLKIIYELEDNVLSAEDFIRLKIATGFWDRPLEQAEKAIKNGLFNVVAKSDGQVIGMGRLVGDGAMYWYLQEIIVLPEYQGCGIGRSIVKRLINYIKENSLAGTQVSIGLTAVHGKESFYEKMGFNLIDSGMQMGINV